MEAWQLHQLLSRELPLTTKLRIRQLVAPYLERTRLLNDPRTLYRQALMLVTYAFRGSEPVVLDSFAKYLLGLARLAVSQPQPFRNEMSEIEALRRQEATQMESRKFQTLSNASKARHDILLNAINNMK